jgi:hypothetical protein
MGWRGGEVGEGLGGGLGAEQHLGRVLMIEDGDGYAPSALARDAPAMGWMAAAHRGGEGGARGGARGGRGHSARWC